MIKIQYRKTYKALNGKSYFTIDTAIKKSVYFKLFKKYEKDGCQDSLGWEGQHLQTEYYTEKQWNYFEKVAQRFIKLYKKIINEAALGGKDE